jgi:TolB protein
MRFAAAAAGLLVLLVGGAGARPLPPSYALPSWSPGGERLVFARALGPGGAVMTSRPDGKSLRRLAKTRVLSEVAWSPRGPRIAYASHGRVFVLRSDGKGRHLVGSGADLVWSPDGTRLAFAGSAVGGPIQIVQAGGGSRLRLTRARFDHAPAWSPDGRRLAFTRAASVGAQDYLYVVGVDGTGLRRLGPQGASPSWSPDGNALAFWQRTDQGVALALYRFGDEQVVRLTRTFAAFSHEPRWSPDGTQLLFTVCGPFGACRLDIAQADGSRVVRLGSGGDATWAPDGRRIAFVARVACAASSVFVMNADGGGQRRITPCR